jgi:phosphoribosyl-ATP pyrophosphohydrolase
MKKQKAQKRVGLLFVSQATYDEAMKKIDETSADETTMAALSDDDASMFNEVIDGTMQDAGELRI